MSIFKSWYVAFKLELTSQANKKPPIDGNDGGVKDRIRSVPFSSRFVDDPNAVDTTRHIYQADESLKDNIAKWGPDLMYYLLQIYDHTWKGVPPKIVEEATHEYVMSNNPIQRFVDEVYERAEGKVGVKSTDVDMAYLLWAQRNGLPTKLPSTLKRDLDIAFNGEELNSNTRKFRMEDQDKQFSGWGGWKAKIN
jgi:phage/plasmid-associated DNA primase